MLQLTQRSPGNVCTIPGRGNTSNLGVLAMRSHRITVACVRCERTFQTVPSDVLRRESKYCSRDCYNARDTLKKLSRAYVDAINAKTKCAHCGAHPIEWHNPEHVELGRERFRIGTMASRGAPLDVIRAELDRCTPLCRRCHMAEDGRMRQFIAAGHAMRERLPKTKPCATCGKSSNPLRHGDCGRCYSRKHPQVRPPMPPDARAASARLGAAKVAAARIGVPLDEYLRQRSAERYWCNRHREWEPREMFSLSKSSPTGIQGMCKQAWREYRREVAS